MGVIKNPLLICDKNKMQEVTKLILDKIINVEPECWNEGWFQSQIDYGVYQFWLGASSTISYMHYKKQGEKN